VLFYFGVNLFTSEKALKNRIHLTTDEQRSVGAQRTDACHSCATCAAAIDDVVCAWRRANAGVDAKRGHVERGVHAVRLNVENSIRAQRRGRHKLVESSTGFVRHDAELARLREWHNGRVAVSRRRRTAHELLQMVSWFEICFGRHGAPERCREVRSHDGDEPQHQLALLPRLCRPAHAVAWMGVCLVCCYQCAAQVQFVRWSEHSGSHLQLADHARLYSRLARFRLFLLQGRSSSKHSLSESCFSFIWSHLLSRLFHHPLLLWRLSAHRRSQLRLVAAQGHLRRTIGLCRLATTRCRAHRDSLGCRLDALVLRHFRADRRSLQFIHRRSQRRRRIRHTLRSTLHRLGHVRRRRPHARLDRLQAAYLLCGSDTHCRCARRQQCALDLLGDAGRVQRCGAPRHRRDRHVLRHHRAAADAAPDAAGAATASADAADSGRLRPVPGADGRLLEELRSPALLSVHVLGQLLDQRNLLLLHA
jgi:hypothetical protein